MCPEQSEKCSVEAHPATVDESQTLLTCTIKPSSVFRPLTALHKNWLIPVAPSTGEKIHCTSSAAEQQASPDSCLEMQELHKLSRGDKTVEDATKSQELHELSRGDKTVDEAASPNFHCTSSAAKAQTSASVCHDSNPELRELPQQSRGDKTVEEAASPNFHCTSSAAKASTNVCKYQTSASVCHDSNPELRELLS
jgi:hypothetical protein